MLSSAAPCIRRGDGVVVVAIVEAVAVAVVVAALTVLAVDVVAAVADADSRQPRKAPPLDWRDCSGCYWTRNNWTGSVFWAAPLRLASSYQDLETS